MTQSIAVKLFYLLFVIAAVFCFVDWIIYGWSNLPPLGQQLLSGGVMLCVGLGSGFGITARYLPKR